MTKWQSAPRSCFDIGELSLKGRMISYRDYAVVVGTEPPTEPYSRGGFLGAGRLSTMIAVALDHIARGYVGVAILVGAETWSGEKIKEVSQRADLPK